MTEPRGAGSLRPPSNQSGKSMNPPLMTARTTAPAPTTARARTKRPPPPNDHPDRPEADARVVEDAAADPRGARARTRSTGHWWRGRTMTVPMTVPRRSVKRSVVVPSRPVDRASGWPRMHAGSVLALGATALAIEPEELQRELAIERWWAWALAGVGVVVTLAALQAPRERRKALVDVA